MSSLARQSGVQLHVTSLPDGRLGPSARAFVDWLAAAGQSVWQVLPLSPPDEHGSPYSSPSAFACSPALLERPRARVTRRELDAYRERHAFWAPSWEAFGGDLADQVRFDREWRALAEYAQERGIRIMGDVPIYVRQEGADQLAWPEYFRADAVAGVPPDAYAATGQLWGNPLYDWEALAADGYRWWIERLRRTFELFHLVRIDHFRAFSAYWAVPRGDETALGGHWEAGPGRAMFDAATAELGPLDVVAEDLGDIDQAVRDLRDDLGFPGMAVLQFGFDPTAVDPVHDIRGLLEHQVVYTATHDNDTTAGWWAELPPERRALAGEAGVTGAEPWWDLIRLAWGSRCELAMTQAQDILGLGSEARMNQPGLVDGSWRWRMPDGALTPALAARLRSLTEETSRLPSSPVTE